MTAPVSDLWRAQGAPRAHLLWDMVTGPMPRGLLGTGDPDLHRIDGRWTMFFGGFSTGFRNRLYRAMLTDGGTLAAGPWQVVTDRRGRASALAADPPRGSWDAGGMHTPSYVPAVAGLGERIYYTGRANTKQFGPGSRYAIGLLHRQNGQWVRREAPIVVGDEQRTSVLEPFVVYADGRYRMWYQANPHEIGPGELPDYQLRYTESEDGITNWSTPAVFADVSEGFFDNAVVRHGDRWIMLLARGTNLHGMPDFPAQGLWWIAARSPSGDRSKWTEPRRLLDTDAAGTPDWFGRGTFAPAIGFEEPGSTRATVLFTGTRSAPKWPRLALRRLVGGHRPPVPAPFYLATGAIEVDLGGAE